MPWSSVHLYTPAATAGSAPKASHAAKHAAARHLNGCLLIICIASALAQFRLYSENCHPDAPYWSRYAITAVRCRESSALQIGNGCLLIICIASALAQFRLYSENCHPDAPYWSRYAITAVRCRESSAL